MEMISYAHKGAPKGQRFRQYAKDKLPRWAVDVRPATPSSPSPLLDATKE